MTFLTEVMICWAGMVGAWGAFTSPTALGPSHTNKPFREPSL